MKLYNTLSRTIEEFVPIEEGQVRLYSCGPTVYHYAHIGNLRTYIFVDTLKRTLIHVGYAVKHVMNITDVGHLVADDDMDDSGEDKMEKGSRREGKTAWEVAEFYTEAFNKDLHALHILPPTIQPRATGFIQEQIDLISTLEDKGFTYKTTHGIAYDTSRFATYNALSKMNLDELKEGARVEEDEEKRNKTDFYLWKFSLADEHRQMEWDSPWGKGFPGWHIECSAMAMKLLGDTIDIHTGGIDHIPVHHTNEIAQSEGVTGKQFVKYWMHGNFITLSGSIKMAKSGDNFYTLQKVVDLGFDPVVYRYFALTAHYRSELEFSIDSLNSAKHTLQNIRNHLYDQDQVDHTLLTRLQSEYVDAFFAAMNEDLNTPKALSFLHEMLGSSLSSQDKVKHLLLFDTVLGLDLVTELSKSLYVLPHTVVEEIQGNTLSVWLELRSKAREEKDWKEADRIRVVLLESGYKVEDSAMGQRVRRT